MGINFKIFGGENYESNFHINFMIILQHYTVLTMLYNIQI